MSVTWLDVTTALLTLGAVARITRLITDDAITAPIRAFLERRATARPLPDGRLAPAPALWRGVNTWAGCAWCASLWVATAACFAHWAWAGQALYLYAAGALTASQVVGLAADWLDSPPPRREITLTPLDVRLTKNDTTPPTS